MRLSSWLFSFGMASCAGRATLAVPDAGEPPLGCFSCGDAGDASLSATIKATLQSSCATGGVELSCHSSGIGGLTLGTLDDFAQLIDVPSTQRPELFRVAPGDPAASYLFLKLVADGGIEGGPMPGGAYDPGLVSLFGGWIEAGAPVR
jgi:hypothetical protein